MKKLACMLLALLLCLTSVAALAATPSKTAADLNKVDVTAENLPANSGFFIRPSILKE